MDTFPTFLMTKGSINLDESSPLKPHDFYPFPGDSFNNGNEERSVHEAPFHNGIFNFHFEDMMKEMDEMIQNLEGVIGGMGGLSDFQKFNEDYTLPSPSNSTESDSVRGQMLKEPDGSMRGDKECLPKAEMKDKPKLRKWDDFSMIFSRNESSTGKQDTDIDGESNLNEIFGSSPNQKNWEIIPSMPQPKSHFRSVVVRTVRTPDGKIEEHRTVRDGSGKEETTVTRKVDDQTHSITTTKRADGTEDVFENYTNIDQRKKEEFEGKWMLPNLFNSETYRQPNQGLLKPENELDKEKSSIFKKLFGHYFSEGKS